MKVNQKLLTTLVIIFNAITMCLVIADFTYGNYLDIMTLFLGISQVLGGLSQINLSKQCNDKGLSKGNKKVGIFLIVVGVGLILLPTVKYIFY